MSGAPDFEFLRRFTVINRLYDGLCAVRARRRDDVLALGRRAGRVAE